MAPGDDRTTRAPLPKRIWRSVFRGPLRPRDDTDRKKIVFNHLILHFRPIRVPEKTIRYTHTFGLGGMSATFGGWRTSSGTPMDSCPTAIGSG